MNVIVLDDEIATLKNIERELYKINYVDKVYTFLDGIDEIAECVKENYIDLAILDINVNPQYTGIDIAKRIRDVSPNTYLLFISGYDDVEKDIFRAQLGQVDFVDKLTLFQKSKEIISRIIESLNLKADPPKNCPIVIRTFGPLSIYVDGVLVNNHISKPTKRIISAAINACGEVLDTESLAINAFFIENPNEFYRVAERKRELKKDIKDKGNTFINEILEIKDNPPLIRFKNENKKIWCDILEFKKGNTAVLQNYNHKYLTDLESDITYEIRQDLEEAYSKIYQKQEKY